LDISLTDSSRALVILPHADDETVAGGLILFLKERGANIHLLTLCSYNESRMNEWS
jgi:LmbE family N-acetylglucosaminyl deacetylase